MNQFRYNLIKEIPLLLISNNLKILILLHDQWIIQQLLEEEEILIWI